LAQGGLNPPATRRLFQGKESVSSLFFFQEPIAVTPSPFECDKLIRFHHCDPAGNSRRHAGADFSRIGRQAAGATCSFNEPPTASNSSI